VAGRPRGKANKQIEKLTEQLRGNHRLFAAFSICSELGIDDPVHWFNSVKPAVVDWWIAFRTVRNEREAEVYEDKNKDMTPAEADEYLFKLTQENNNASQ